MDTRLIWTPCYHRQFCLSLGKASTFSLNSTRLYGCKLMQTTDTYFLPNQQILIKANLAHADTSLSTVSCNRPFIFEGEKTFS